MTQPDKLVVSQEAIRAAISFNKETRTWATLLKAHDRAARDTVELAEAFQRAMNQAAADEREASAKVAEGMNYFADHLWDEDTCVSIATAIRERTT